MAGNQKIVYLGGAAVEAGALTSALSEAGFVVGRGDEFSEKLTLKAGEAADILIVALPGLGARMDLQVELAGEGASCRIYGLYLCPGEERIGLNIRLVHSVPGCFSNQLLKGIVSGRARAGFSGRIYVAQDAQRTEAYQANHSLLLSDTAKVDTQPELEIYADDVKCSHGATVGKLNEDEQFYMRSRGIPEQEARVLQMLSFLSPVLDILPEGEHRERVRLCVEDMVRDCF